MREVSIFRQFEKLAVGCSEPTQRLFTWVSEFINTYVERVQKLQSGSKKPEKDKKDVMASLSLLSSETHRVTQKLGECRLTMPPELPNLGKSGISIRATKILELTDSQGRPINCGGTGILDNTCFAVSTVFRTGLYPSICRRTTNSPQATCKSF